MVVTVAKSMNETNQPEMNALPAWICQTDVWERHMWLIGEAYTLLTVGVYVDDSIIISIWSRDMVIDVRYNREMLFSKVANWLVIL